MNPSSFTHEYLSGLKFKELQKLSVQYHVNKRWAKKQELIDNLLALKNNSDTDKTPDDNHDEEKEWRDGSTMFNDLNQNSNENEINRRLTFNVSTKSNIDPRATFDVPQKGKNSIDSNEIVNSRETYDVPPSKTDFGIDPRATFDVPQKEKLLVEEIDHRATFVVPQNGKQLFDNGKNSDKENKKDVKKTTPVNPKGNNEKSSEKVKSEVKMLTIPYARLTRRNRKDGEASKNDNSPIKLSKKSINIKKSVRLPTSKTDLIKSPMLSSIKKSVTKQAIMQSIRKVESGKVTQSKIPKKLHFNEDKSKTIQKSAGMGSGDKENVNANLQRPKSRTADEALGKKSNLLKVSFMTPPASLRRNKRGHLPLNKTPLRSKPDGSKLNSSLSQTPGGKPPVTTKPITTTKMPDFSKIHKKQFEQMDSLHDYIKRKEERTRKLFGIPQPGSQLQGLNKSMPIFQFQSSIPDKGSQGSESVKKLTTPFKKKENDAKAAQKEAFKHKLPPSKLQTDIKDKNRSHIHGVRTNKRFELQMKFRQM